MSTIITLLLLVIQPELPQTYNQMYTPNHAFDVSVNDTAISFTSKELRIAEAFKIETTQYVGPNLYLVKGKDFKAYIKYDSFNRLRNINIRDKKHNIIVLNFETFNCN
jgi:hypothetical protein